jgi:hypothetical protein
VAVEGIGNLTQTIADLFFGQAANPQGADASGAATSSSAAVTEDTFTHSNQVNPAQHAEALQVGQGAPNAITANALFAPATPNGDQDRAVTQASSASAAKAHNALPAAAKNSVTPVNPGQLFPPPPAEQTAAEQAAATANVQYQIQSLNSQLPALGLTTEEVQEIDRIASQIQNFNPAAYATLVSQFELLANPSTQPPTANAAADANPVPTPNASTNAKA